ncbi:LRR receptor-like serine/threonine-protein kinase [Heracleum sosnowskyi]|uniref:LRR receptor-like serine/threonine-protein kinase n=1 Tax=Heracleum sosnowskyi TaxID=360622 RepID=A0AAD8HDT6_9APIA|nr:LRR receptor-like serine/threonine-protein kinase [Heracleum sosnowskyi]
MSTSHNSFTFEFSSEWLPPFQLGEPSLASCKLGPKFPNWIRNQRHIGHLDISNSQISDTIPIWFSNLSSVIHCLNLSSNKIRAALVSSLRNRISGTIPPCFGNLSSMINKGTEVTEHPYFSENSTSYRNLGYNNFSGRIPMSMGHLISLQTLILRNNKLNGELPTSLRNYSSLGFVDFGLNKLSGNVPSWIGEGLTQLYALILKSNRFQGNMPNEICHLANLHFLDVSINRISGTIPPCLGNLSSMINKGTEVTEHPYFSKNSTSYMFTDTVLARWKGQEFEYVYQIGYPSTLQYLSLRDSDFNGCVPIPKFIGSLNNLRYLDLSSSCFTGVIPHEFENLSKLQYLNISFNIFNCPIPKHIGSLNSLRFLDLSNSGFTGVIPHELGNLSELQYLDLANNGQTDGGNFGWLFNLSSLTYLDLSTINVAPSSIWVSFIQRIPSISVMRLSQCNLLAPSSTLGNFSSSISTLHLQQNYLNSSIFDWLPQLSSSLEVLDLHDNVLKGRIPESFGHMTSLTYLNLGHNLLNGPIPNTFGLMTALSYLDLNANQLNGAIPNTFALMKALTYLDLSANHLNGEIPDSICNLSSLKVVHFSFNNLTGSLPDFTLLPSLEELLVNFNQLDGFLPTVFKHHSNLKVLDLSNNYLRGSLPDFTGSSSLESLYLDNNEFSGSLPDFTGCSSLQVLYLGKNQFTEWETQSTGLLSSLVDLDLSMNSIHSTISEAHLSNLSSLNQISDTIPFWFWNISRSLSLLNLSYNEIRGKFSYIHVRIREIDLSSNYFDGPLPPIPEDCVEIHLSKNNFSGTLLSLRVVENLPLSYLDISHNQLFGVLPDYWMHFQGLGFLNLGYNNFSGRIPTSIGHLVSLQTLILRHNALYGELPVSLRNCRSLGFVDFGFNRLSGKVPSWIGEDLMRLYALILSSNRFYGSLPNEICHLSNLHFLDLSINKISGKVPPCFGNFTSMINNGYEVSEHIYSSEANSYSYFDDALARLKGQEFESGRNFAYLKMIDLSINELNGEFPLSITRLLGLKGLNLSGNRFHGEVPSEIGRLKVLESLDLSMNKFSGKIPTSMDGLSFLAFLDLSDNNFSGRIPSGAQFRYTFDNFTYEGNVGLCGKPVTNKCPEDDPADHVLPSSGPHEVDGDDNEYERWLYISVVLGFSTSFWSFIGTLILNRRWRHAYFLLLDSFKERVHVVMAVHVARLRRKA